jgi:CDP-diglyceride synthetase
MTASGTRTWAAANWFLLVLPLLLAVSWLFTRSVDWQSSARSAEAVTLFDWMVSIPLLYFLCYRDKVRGKAMAIRLLGLACLGVWIASRLVPAEAQGLLPHLSWPRMAGLAVLALIELRLLVLALKLAFSGNASAEELANAAALPRCSRSSCWPRRASGARFGG